MAREAEDGPDGVALVGGGYGLSRWGVWHGWFSNVAFLGPEGEQG